MHYQEAPAQYRSTLRFTVRTNWPSAFTKPVWLRAKVSKQILCLAISLLISLQNIIVLESHKIIYCVPTLYRVRRFQFNNQLFAPNCLTDASLICIGVFSIWKSVYALSLLGMGLSALYGFSLSLCPSIHQSVTLVIHA